MSATFIHGKERMPQRSTIYTAKVLAFTLQGFRGAVQAATTLIGSLGAAVERLGLGSTVRRSMFPEERFACLQV